MLIPIHNYTISGGQDPFNVQFKLLKDSIAQEGEETFTLNFSSPSSYDGETVSSIEVTIQDTTGEFELWGTVTCSSN